MYIFDQHNQPPSSYSTRSRARNPPLERVLFGAKPRIPDINVKFAFRLSTSPPPSFLFVPLVFRHRGRNCLFRYPSTRLYFLSSAHSFLPALISLLSCVFSDLFFSSTSPIFLLARNFDSVSFEHPYIHFYHFKALPLIFLFLSCCSFLLLDRPSSFFLSLVSAKQQTKYERRNSAPAWA